MAWLAYAVLVAGCSDPGAVEEQRPESVVFGPGTVAFNAPDLEPVDPWRHLGFDGDGSFRWTFEQQDVLELTALCGGCLADTVTAAHPALRFGEPYHALPFNAVWASVRAGEVVLRLRSHLGFDLDAPDSSAVVTVHGSLWDDDGGSEPVVDRSWYRDDVGLADGSGLALRAPVLRTGRLDVPHTSYYWAARWPAGAHDVHLDPLATLETSIRGELALDSLVLWMTPFSTSSREAPLAGEGAHWAEVEGTTGTLHLEIRNPTGGHFVISTRADVTLDPVLVDVPAGDTSLDIPLDHAQLLRAAPSGFTLLLELHPAEETVAAHFAPDRPLEVEGTLRVYVPPPT